MGTKYRLPLSKQEGETTVTNDIIVGDRNIQFRFQWAVASEEQLNLLLSYIDTKMRSDPLVIEGAYVRNYDYMNYYLGLSDKNDTQLEEWLDSHPILPASIERASRASQLLMIHTRVAECEALDPVLKQYKEVVRWQFHSIYNNEVNVGFIEPGGWYRSQDTGLQFRFVSELPYIGKEDFNQVTLEFEVGDA